MKNFAMPTTIMSNLNALVGREVRLAGTVTNVKKYIGKYNEENAFVTIEDYDGTYDLRLFGGDYNKYKEYW